jgi:hypothetical protein
VGRGAGGRMSTYDDGLFIPDDVLNSLSSTQHAMILRSRDDMRRRVNESGGQRSAKRVHVEIPHTNTTDPNTQTTNTRQKYQL